MKLCVWNIFAISALRKLREEYCKKGQSYSEIHSDCQANQDFTVRTYTNETKFT